MTPELLTALFIKLLADRAVSSTCPPSAWINPPFSTRALTAPAFTVTLSRPSPATSRVIAVPEANATVPSWAAITPVLLTWAPSNAT
jgi:hypothetical protein